MTVKKYWYGLTEEQVEFLDLALAWMRSGLADEKKEPVHHLERALCAAQQVVMVRIMQKRLHDPDREESV